MVQTQILTQQMAGSLTRQTKAQQEVVHLPLLLLRMVCLQCLGRVAAEATHRRWQMLFQVLRQDFMAEAEAEVERPLTALETLEQVALVLLAL
jgi:hypothetical protein